MSSASSPIESSDGISFVDSSSSDGIEFIDSTGSGDDSDASDDIIFVDSDSSFEPSPTKRLRLQSSIEEPVNQVPSLSTVAVSTEETEVEGIASILTSSCCDRVCVRDITVNDILSCRRKYSEMSTVEQRQWLTNKILENSNPIDWATKYIVAGKEVCKETFCQVYLLSPKRLYRVRKAVSQGQVNAHHGNKGRKKVSTRVNEAKTWMERYFNLIGDKMPDKNQIHLPSWDRQIDIYQRFKDDMKEMGRLDT